MSDAAPSCQMLSAVIEGGTTAGLRVAEARVHDVDGPKNSSRTKTQLKVVVRNTFVDVMDSTPPLGSQKRSSSWSPSCSQPTAQAQQHSPAPIFYDSIDIVGDAINSSDAPAADKAAQPEAFEEATSSSPRAAISVPPAVDAEWQQEDVPELQTNISDNSDNETPLLPPPWILALAQEAWQTSYFTLVPVLLARFGVFNQIPIFVFNQKLVEHQAGGEKMQCQFLISIEQDECKCMCKCECKKKKCGDKCKHKCKTARCKCNCNCFNVVKRICLETLAIKAKTGVEKLRLLGRGVEEDPDDPRTKNPDPTAPLQLCLSHSVRRTDPTDGEHYSLNQITEYYKNRKHNQNKKYFFRCALSENKERNGVSQFEEAMVEVVALLQGIYEEYAERCGDPLLPILRQDGQRPGT